MSVEANSTHCINSKLLENKSERVQDFLNYELRDDITSIKGEDKRARLAALKSFNRKILNKHTEFSENEYLELVDRTYKTILKVFSDASENCRETSISILTHYFKNISLLDYHLAYVIPILVQRLGKNEIIESSEEIRLLELQLLTLIVSKLEENNLAYMNDIVQILSKTIVDPYPEVKKESCYCAGVLATALKKHFHLQSETLLVPLISTLSHQHSKVRQACIKALKFVILYGSNKSVGDVISHLAQRLFDPSPIVRKEMAYLIGTWLCELPDRYSFFSKLIPLHLSLLNDEVSEISHLSQEFWLKAGDIYLKENEETYKDQIDFENSISFPEGISKSSKGCSILVQRHIYYILPALINDLKDWCEETRIKASNLLSPLVLHCNVKISAYNDKLLPALCRAMGDENKDVVKASKQCAYYVGHFVDMPIILKVFNPLLTISPSPGNFEILASLLAGNSNTSPDDIKALCDELVLHSLEVDNLKPIQKCIEALLQKPGVPGFPIFLIILRLEALGISNADANMALLTSYLHCDSTNKLYQMFSHQALLAIQEGYTLWTVSHPNFLVFITLLSSLGPSFKECAEVTLGMLKELLTSSSDAKLKLRIFTTLAVILPNFIKHWEDSNVLEECISKVVSSMILPNLDWHAGRTSSALRNAAMICLWSTVSTTSLAASFLKDNATTFLSQLTSLLEDDNGLTRKLALLSLTHLFPQFVPFVDYNHIILTYPEVMKRLDDVTNEVRLSAANFFPVFFQYFPNSFDVHHHRAYYEEICKGLLIHLDDPDPKFQDAILEVLKKISSISPQILLDLLEEVMHKHRTPHFCQLLKEHIKALLQSSSS